MKICVIGQGYIGLPTALLFSNNDCKVVGVDLNQEIITKLNKGQITIEEEGLQQLLSKVLNKNYTPKTTPEEADAYIITVPTPYHKENYECDLNYVLTACESIIPYLKKGNTIIIESTIAPLSMKNQIKPLFEKEGYNIGTDIYLSHCPERVLPGNIIHELINNNRIIGGITAECANKSAQVYQTFVKGNIIKTTAEIAEMSKCMENTYRDVNIALANELVKICDKIGINALEVLQTANQHPRVNLHSPGPGVGGHCLAIDPYFIYALAPTEANIIKASRDTNNSMPQFVVNKVQKLVEKGQTITILGIAYKGNSDDDRESPAYTIINELRKEYEIRIYDPHIPEKSIEYHEAIKNSSLLLILTGHNEFKTLNYQELIENMHKPIIVDTCNLISLDDVPKEITAYNYGNIYEIGYMSIKHK